MATSNDALGRRITRTQGANVRDFHFFGASDLSDYETKDGALSTSLLRGPDGLFLYNAYAGNETYYGYQHHSPHGDTTLITDETGASVYSARYDAFGNSLTAGSLGFGYTGKWQRYYDSAAGTIRMGVRDYDPRLGRFTGADPLKGDPLNPQTRNRYEYALNNPLRYYDLDGMYPGEGIVNAFSGTWRDVGGGAAYAYRQSGHPNSLISGGAGAFWGNWKTGFNSMSRGEQVALLAVPTVAIGAAVGVEAAGVGGVVLGADALAAGVGGMTARMGIKCVNNTSKTASAVSRSTPLNLAEKLALEEAKSRPGTRIMQGKINDPNYPESLWAKMQYVHRSLDGKTQIEIHYWQNLQTGTREGFKFK